MIVVFWLYTIISLFLRVNANLLNIKMLCSLQLISKCFMHAYASIHAHTHRANMINVTIIESLSGNTIVVVPLILSYQLSIRLKFGIIKRCKKIKLDRDTNS